MAPPYTHTHTHTQTRFEFNLRLNFLIFWVLIFEINDFSVSLDNEFCKSDLQKRENSQGKKKQLKIKIQAINSSESFEVLFQVKCLIILSRAEGILWEAIAGKIEYEDLEKFNHQSTMAVFLNLWASSPG